MSICQKCGKEYIPKRKGGKFCSTSCRVVQHQRIKKGEAWPNLTTPDEQYLANKLAAVGRTAVNILAQVNGLPVEQGFKLLQGVVSGWTGLADNGIIERIQENERRQNSAFAARMNRTRKPASVNKKRKQSPQA